MDLLQNPYFYVNIIKKVCADFGAPGEGPAENSFAGNKGDRLNDFAWRITVLLVQNITLVWHKTERGAAGAQARARFPLAYDLPEPELRHNVLLHNLRFIQCEEKFIDSLEETRRTLPVVLRKLGLTEAEIEQRVAQRLWQARKYEKQTYRNADELNLANLAFEYCGENLAVNFAYDERRSGSPRRRGRNRDYHNQQSLWHGRDCLNEEAFLLEPGQYGRIIWNERCADCDTGHWYYQLHIYNILLFKRGVPPADILLTRQPDYEYSQLADLY